MAKHRIYSPDILNKTSMALMFTNDTFYIFVSFIINSSIYAVFRFASLRDMIFILFSLMTWPKYLFLKRTLPDLLRIKWPSPKRYIGGSRGGQTPFFVLDYRMVIRILTEYFQFRPCHFSFYHVL